MFALKTIGQMLSLGVIPAFVYGLLSKDWDGIRGALIFWALSFCIGVTVDVYERRKARHNRPVIVCPPEVREKLMELRRERQN